ncbi:MAG TPA: VOC family protein [Terriglobales bacterium]|jgi:catechol 2,3-dioxygenase-like lactoylglutathione lyase family enzyme|nr:VOC family protein [Terriglobales bacterium]
MAHLLDERGEVMTAHAASSETAITQIGQIAINVHDTDRAVEFYRDILGLKLLFTAGHLAFFDCGGVRLMLSPPERPEFDHPASILYFKVADIKAAHARLVERNVKIESEPHMVARMPDHDLWLADFRDSEGNIMAFMSEVRR